MLDTFHMNIEEQSLAATQDALAQEGMTFLKRLEQTMADQINVAIIGLGFGAEFIPIYQIALVSLMPGAMAYFITREVADVAQPTTPALDRARQT